MKTFGHHHNTRQRTRNAERGIDDSSSTAQHSSLTLHPLRSANLTAGDSKVERRYRSFYRLMAAGLICLLLGGAVFSSAQSGRSTTSARRTLIVNIIARHVDDPTKVRPLLSSSMGRMPPSSNAEEDSNCVSLSNGFENSSFSFRLLSMGSPQ